MLFSPSLATPGSLYASLAAGLYPDGLHNTLALWFAQSSTSIFAPQASPARSIFGLSMLVLGICARHLPRRRRTAALYPHPLPPSPRRTPPASPRRSTAATRSSSPGPSSPSSSWSCSFCRPPASSSPPRARPSPPQRSMSPSSATSSGGNIAIPSSASSPPTSCTFPVSDPNHPTPTYLTMSSADTDHSFWVPRLAGKMDLIPNSVNTMWIDPDHAGLYLGQCAQYCGIAACQDAPPRLRRHARTSSPPGSRSRSSPPRTTQPSPRAAPSSSTTPASTATPSPAPAATGSSAPI